MKLTFKDLKQQKFVIDAEPSETIGGVKAKIAAEKGWEASTQKLIYSGKILQDDNTVESYKIEEKGFIVCMTQKPKAAPAKPAVPSTPAPSTARTSTPAAPAPAPAPPTANIPAVPATPTPAPSAATTEGSTFNDPSALALGEQRAAAISNMEAMGFPRADIDRAMRAAFFNPDRAVEYLLNGIPESALREQQQATQRPAANPASPPPAGDIGAPPPLSATGEEPLNLFEAAAQAGQGRGGARGAAPGGLGALAAAAGAPGAGAGAGAGAVTNLDFLRSNPQFQQLRQVVQAQPQMLEPILQQVVAGNPQIAQLISAHPEQFMQLLAEDADDDAALPPGTQSVSVTEEESQAIERLERLGFDRDIVIQAYFACDKNEELAANFLFDQPEEPDE